MVFVNKRAVPISLGILFIILFINIDQSIGSYPSGIIREENYVNRKLKAETGKNNKKADRVYTNKEVVFGSEDDDDDNDDLRQKLGDTPVNVKPVQRSQRIDLKNMKHQDQYEHKIKSFHKNKNLQRDYLKKQEENFDLNYDSILDELLQNSDLFEDVMNMKDIGTSIGKNRFDDLDQEHMPVDELINNNNKHEHEKSSSRFRNFNKKKFNTNNNNLDKLTHSNNKPVKYYDVKENLFPEKEYNKQFIHENNLENDVLLPEDEDLLKKIDDLNLDLGSQATKDHEKKPINSNPSMANKQPTLTVDPTFATIDQIKKQNNYLFIFVIAGCSMAGVIALIAAGVCWYTVYRSPKGIDDNYGTKNGKLSPSGSLKSNSTSSGDRRLAQSAQMYHYQHQKQQMIAMEKANNDAKPENSDNSDGETEEGDYTVYECPGLAPTGEMEVKNPLFKEEFSSNSIYQSTLPPSYSTVSQQGNETSPKSEQLIDLEEKKEDSKSSVQPAESIAIDIQETSPTSQN
ncbi:unnamed protein product [Brachionus calyciflorus]|uniref:Neural proliferation differentiation and control protein 1 n=1 Tax=Brachionus calyciflorus TaxID=104777 RepID=A0A813MD12_9BILA|nr:unnamed protein product [Brachionus calyciflorus]